MIVEVISIAGLVGCGLWGPEGGPGGPAGPAGGPEASAITNLGATQATRGADGVQRLTLTVTDELRYTPSTMTATTGIVEITVQNRGQTPHTVTLSALPDNAGPSSGIDNLNAGQTLTFRLRMTQPGSYPFACAYHNANGMRAELQITAEQANPTTS